MSYRIYSGDKKSLVFPIMGDGYVHLDYSKHIPTGSEDPYGLWGHDSSFTIEGIITPYDINGFSWTLAADFDRTGGNPSVDGNVDSDNLDLPFTDKAFSSVGNISGATSSRSSAYFSHEHVAYLGTAISSTSQGTAGDGTPFLVVSNIENLEGGNHIRIGNEQMKIVSIDRDYGKGAKIEVTRGANGTIATTHLLNAPIYTDRRKSHKMSLFYNPNCEFYLKNMTRSNMNQPAEYKIGCVLKGKDVNGNTRTITVESNNPVITADEEYYGRTVEQPAWVDGTFGKPVYLNKEDRVKYHVLVMEDGTQVMTERVFTLDSDTTIDTSSHNITFSNTNSTITRSGGTWPTDIVYIKVVGSSNNDGFYKVSNRAAQVLTLDTTQWVAAGNSATTLLSSGDMTSGTLKVFYSTRAVNTQGAISFIEQSSNSHNGSAAADALDMSERVWRGRKLYAQTAASKTYGLQLEQTEPIYLGYIESASANASTDKIGVTYMAACKLVKPVRTTTETTFYVDDARDLTINETLRFGDEIITITAISGNTLTVTRGTDSSTAETSKLDAYNNNSTPATNYTINVKEEYNFSRTLYKIFPDTLLNGVKLVIASGADSHQHGIHVLSKTWKEASYVLRPFHLAMGYDAQAKRITLMLDGVPVPTQQFNEGDLRISSMDASSSTTVTITTIDPHGLAVGDWISIEGSNPDSGTLDGIWQLPSQTVGTNSFTITTGTVTVSNSTGTVKDVTIRTNNTITDFEFDQSDCYLGSNGNDTLETRRASQFMGEMHEFAITKDVKENFNSLDTLLPNFRNTLLYFRFEGDNS